jgi:predicted alpha/beta-hydrolase family hydrolase
VALNRSVIIKDVPTAVGGARTSVSGRGKGLLVLGHGAGGGIDALDLLAARDAALSLGWRVALVEQPWRVRGRRIAEAPPRLDRAWIDVLAGLKGAPLVFPLHPPGRPDKTRLPELQAVRVPVLVVQGTRDAFGVPDGAHLVPGADHGFKVAKGHEPAGPQVETAVREFLARAPAPTG